MANDTRDLREGVADDRPPLYTWWSPPVPEDVEQYSSLFAGRVNRELASKFLDLSRQKRESAV